MKKLLLSLLTFLASLPMVAYDLEYKGLYYNELASSNKLEVTYKEQYKPWISGDVEIPETVPTQYSEYTVTKIGGYAFSYCSGLKSVKMPDSITEIGLEAFGYCTGLREVEIPPYVTEIDQFAFWECSNLTNVILSKSLTKIGGTAFGRCISLVSIEIPDSVCYISGGAFEGCVSLKSIEIPDSVAFIGNYAFESCSELSSVSLGSGLTQLEGSVFEKCNKIKEVKVRAATPPEAKGTCFTDKTYQNATLYVPGASLELYRETYPWSRFLNIADLESMPETGGVDSTETYNNCLPAAIFTISGVCVKHNASSQDIEALDAGIYIIGRKKVVVK